MRPFTRLGVAVSFALALVGCGGGGGGLAGLSTFEGIWGGTQRFFNSAGTVQEAGAVGMTVDKNGNVNGTMAKTDPVTGQTETVPMTGYLYNTGQIELVWTYSGQLQRRASGNTTYSGGQLKPNTQNGRINVSNVNGGVGSLEFTMVKTG